MVCTFKKCILPISISKKTNFDEIYATQNTHLHSTTFSRDCLYIFAAWKIVRSKYYNHKVDVLLQKVAVEIPGCLICTCVV